VGLSPRQQRNQPQTREVPTVPATGGPSYGWALAEGLDAIKAAYAQSMVASSKRQADAKAWMDRGLSDPAPSGDRGPTNETYAGHVGEVLGVGRSPGEDLLPAAQTNNRLPDPAPPAPPVSSSGTRPKGMAGLQFNWRPAPAAVPGPQSFSKGSVTYVSVDQPGGRSGLLGWLRNLFGGAK
jgi:hypothetical protein